VAPISSNAAPPPAAAAADDDDRVDDAGAAADEAEARPIRRRAGAVRRPESESRSCSVASTSAVRGAEGDVIAAAAADDDDDDENDEGNEIPGGGCRDDGERMVPVGRCRPVEPAPLAVAGRERALNAAAASCHPPTITIIHCDLQTEARTHLHTYARVHTHTH